MAISITVRGSDGQRLSVNGVLKRRPLSEAGNRYVVNTGLNDFVATSLAGGSKQLSRTLSANDRGTVIDMRS